ERPVVIQARFSDGDDAFVLSELLDGALPVRPFAGHRVWVYTHRREDSWVGFGEFDRSTARRHVIANADDARNARQLCARKNRRQVVNELGCAQMGMRINQHRADPLDSSISPLLPSPIVRDPSDPRVEERPTVSVIVVTYQSEGYVGRCLASIRAHAGMPVETLVVDNASTDATVAEARRFSLATSVITLPANRGFAAAVNVAAPRATGEFLLLLNPDAELLHGALPRLVALTRRCPTVAAAGPQFLFPDGSPQDSAFTYPTLLMTWLEFFPRPARLLRTRLNGRLASTDGRPIRVDHPLGACMLIRRAAWDDVGPLDEAFFLYCEEVDWCVRAKKRGWVVAHVPDAAVVHHGGRSAARARA